MLEAGWCDAAAWWWKLEANAGLVLLPGGGNWKLVLILVLLSGGGSWKLMLIWCCCLVLEAGSWCWFGAADWWWKLEAEADSLLMVVAWMSGDCPGAAGVCWFADFADFHWFCWSPSLGESPNIEWIRFAANACEFDWKQQSQHHTSLKNPYFEQFQAELLFIYISFYNSQNTCLNCHLIMVRSSKMCWIWMAHGQ